MDKKTFLSELSREFESRGIATDIAGKYLNRFETYFSRISDEQAIVEISGYDPISTIVDKIFDAETKDDEPQIEDSEVSPDNRGESASPTDELRMISELSEEISECEDKVRSTADETVQISEENDCPESDPQPLPSTKTIDLDNAVSDKERRRKNITKHEEDDPGQQDERALTEIEDNSAEAENAISFDDLDGVSNTKETAIFWLLFILTLPITISLILTIAGLFAVAFTTVAIAIVAIVFLIIALSAGGTGVSLFGIIYGVIKCTSSIPEGLYEIGFAITIGGLTLLAGILLYNFAIRLLPHAIRYIYKFMLFVASKLMLLFKYLKKECIGH